MPTLPVDELVKGLKHGKPLTSVTIDDEVLDQYVERVMAQHMTLGTESVEDKQLLRHMKEQLDFVSPDKRYLLSQCEIYVLPFPLCISYAHEFENRKIILIATGLIDLIANTIFASYVQASLPTELDEYFFLKFRRDMPASHLFANALFLLQLHFYRYCSPLPNLQALLSPEMLKEAKDGINGALVFIMLHELGHHQLGHLESKKIRPMRYHKIIDESYSIDQHQEMDADNFALESLIEPARVIGTFWHQNAINFFMQIALVSGEHSGADHPLSINRAYYSDSLRSDLGKVHDVSPRYEFFETIASRYMATQRASTDNANVLINTSREGCLEILKETNRVLKHFNMDISPIWQTSCPGWLEMKFS